MNTGKAQNDEVQDIRGHTYNLALFISHSPDRSIRRTFGGAVPCQSSPEPCPYFKSDHPGLGPGPFYSALSLLPQNEARQCFQVLVQWCALGA